MLYFKAQPKPQYLMAIISILHKLSQNFSSFKVLVVVLCDSKGCNFSFRFLRSHRATVLSADLWQEWAHYKDWKKGSSLEQCEHQLSGLVWKYCLKEYARSWVSDHQQPTQRGTHGADARRHPLAVCSVKMVFTSTTFPSFGTALMSHRQMVWSSEALSKCPLRFGFQESP